LSHACPIYEVRSLSALRAPRETPHRPMKDTCPTPLRHMRVRIALQRKSAVLDWKLTYLAPIRA